MSTPNDTSALLLWLLERHLADVDGDTGGELDVGELDGLVDLALDRRAG